MLKWPIFREPRELSRIKRKRTIVALFFRVQNYLGWLLYVFGVISFIAFPFSVFHKVHRDTDEKAVLPAQVARYFDSKDILFFNQVKSNLTLLQDLLFEQVKSTLIIHDLFNSVNIKTEPQHFSYYNGSKVRLINRIDEWINGTNVYGVFTPSKTDGTESILLSAPRYNADGKFNLNGLALIITLSKFTQRFSFWARKFIFLVPDHSPVGSFAFLKAYHGLEGHDSLSFDPLLFQAGQIQEALNFEFGEGDPYSHIGLFVHGLNGQQPNADLIAAITIIANQGKGYMMNLKDGLPITLHNRAFQQNHDDTFDAYTRNARNMIEYMAYQGLGIPVMDHSFYAYYRIEAVTFVGVESPHSTFGYSRKPVTMYLVSRLIESTLRSLNNLLERLHHSFWFYILADVDKFVMISFYIAPTLFLFIGLIVECLALWYSDDNIDYNETKNRKILEGKKFNYHQRPRGVDSFSRTYRSFWIPSLLISICHLCGLSVYYLAMNGFSLTMVFFTFVLIVPTFTKQLCQIKYEKLGSGFIKLDDWKVTKSLLCYELSLLYLMMASVNPSLSIWLSFISVPFILQSKPLTTFVSWIRMGILFVIASPLGYAFLYHLLLSFTPNQLFILSRFNIGVVDSFSSFMRVFFEELGKNWDLFGVFTFPVFCLVYLPCILVGLAIHFMND